MMAELAPDRDEATVGRIRGALIAWYRCGHRDLPWRRGADPYRILVSETMLVQTTVAAVIPFFAKFLERFPDVRALAEAEEHEVLKSWEGLGYYRRARQLHEAAKRIVRDHGGEVPDDPDAILALPGVGRYIAGAVLSFAFNRRAPIVEANTQRVLSRVLAWPDDLAASSSQKRLWEAAENLVPDDEPGTFNQAFMELGATICTPREPRCLLCPVVGECRARALGLQNQLPRKTKKAAPLDVEERCALVIRDGRILMVQRGPDRLWAGFWEFPTIHLAGADPAGRSFGEPVGLELGVQRLTNVRIREQTEAKSITFGVTKHRVKLTAVHALDDGNKPIPYTGYMAARFVDPGELTELTMGSAMRKLAGATILKSR